MQAQGRIKWQTGTDPSKVVDECNLHYENHDIEDIYKRWDNIVEQEHWEPLESALNEIIGIITGKIVPVEQSEQQPVTSKKKNKRKAKTSLVETADKKSKLNTGDPKTQEAKPFRYEKLVTPVLQRHKILVRKAVLLYAYQTFLAEGKLERCLLLEDMLITKKSKSASGILSITVLTSPYPTVDGKKQRFSCEWNCYYCPNQPGQPRSYLRDEPAVLRANQNGFDPVLQFTDRAACLAQNGHPVDKVELLVLGGTWSSYQDAYQEAFVRDLFYAANTFMHRKEKLRERKSLLEEQIENETALCKIIGLTLETRPDTINLNELQKLRRYGCTRVQIGIQHTSDAILDKINRQSTLEDARNAIRLLKQACFKIDVHLMPNLPGATPKMDNTMFDQMLDDPTLQADQWKIYPCEVTPWTLIKKWYDEGKFVPYPDEDLIEVIVRVKARIHPWIRLNRIIRDIPKQYILGGIESPSLRQDLSGIMKSKGLKCDCIRCREVGLAHAHRMSEAVLTERTYPSSGGMEHFLSFETPDHSVIFGFVRLRVPGGDEDNIGTQAFPELEGAALVRELHVYGKLIATSDPRSSHAQHVGFGTRLMKRAEDIAFSAGFSKIAVIAGVGTREYYKKLGYRLDRTDAGGFPIKRLDTVGVVGRFVESVSSWFKS
uniref:tRNA carboxymethyluridine synthase n=1 Tax=Mucochytrium quahogii TaxID=96639 RepID=A0A7S2RIL5_9STRA|mmetsp:Transcript_32167/g.51164  ORF Transcript_32167/g.51164 Transcript_32167/m.51164 type:complete len:660 (+) Transcript_32167:92-2071(+)